MDDEFAPQVERKRGCGFWLMVSGGILGVLIVFSHEAGLLWRIVWGGLMNAMGRNAELPAAGDLLEAFVFLAANALVAGMFAFVIVLLISQVILPVHTATGRRHVGERLLGFLNGFRPPVIFVKEGVIVTNLPDANKLRGGVAIVDLNSAIVLERQWIPMVLNVGGSLDTSRSASNTNHPGRVGGPGVVFVGLNERLRGTVSLRKQFRINLNVRAYTSDGIEVENHVFAIFSLGLPPTVIKVAYQGEMQPENLRVIHIDDNSKKIKSISDDLDDVDRLEIHQFAQSFLTSREATAALEATEKGREYPPFTIDEERILNAVYSQGRSVEDSKPDKWSDLPSLVATEVFRNLISQVTYDEIYLPKDPDHFPLQQELKPSFARQVKALGVMSYQFMHRLDSLPLEAGQKVDFRQFRMSTVQSFRSPKILRDRGIKVIHAGFTELRPTDPVIRKQRLENWRSYWQREADQARAVQDLEVSRILSRARAEKQREMITSLSNILQSSSYSEEALVLRVFQALEDITTDPAALRIVPRDTIHMLRNLQMFLLPDDRAAPRLLADRNPEESELENEH